MRKDKEKLSKSSSESNIKDLKEKDGPKDKESKEHVSHHAKINEKQSDKQIKGTQQIDEKSKEQKLKKNKLFKG